MVGREDEKFAAAGTTVPAAAPGAALVPVAPPQLPAVRSRGAHWLGIALALLAVIAGMAGIGWFTLWRPLEVATVHPWRGNAVEAVYATGIVEAIDTARVGTTVAARIVTLTVDEGDTVQTGQLLAQLDDRQAQQRLQDARARLTLAEQELARDRTLVPAGARSLQQLQHSIQERDQAAAGVQLFQRQLEDYRIVAPLTGIVMKRPVEPGETVAANAALFEVASTARLRIAADVDERDIAGVQMGAPVAIHAEGFPNEAFAAVVTNIRREGDTATRTFRVEANLPGDTKLFIGMTVDVNVVIGERANALLVPADAVRHDAPQGGRPGQGFVFRVLDGRAARTNVVTGAVGATAVEIRDGLADDAVLVAAPADGLSDGQRIVPLP